MSPKIIIVINIVANIIFIILVAQFVLPEGIITSSVMANIKYITGLIDDIISELSIVIV